MNFLVVSVASLAILVLVYGASFVIGRRIGRYNVVDVTWGASFVIVAAVVAWHMIGKSAGKGEDPRYHELLKGDFSAANVIRRVFLIQAALAWFISLPLQLSASLRATPPGLLPVLIAGVTLWVVGVLFEAVGDHQLRQFKADAANKGRIMDRGLWSWTRHPNYFGDSAVWWGLWLITITGWLSLTTVLSPVAMTYFLVYATGARLTERIMADRQGFREYCARTSFFVPRPP
jgi:steroid 5-alpha reductase family enzyme